MSPIKSLKPILHSLARYLRATYERRPGTLDFEGMVSFAIISNFNY